MHVSILVPSGDCVLSSAVGPFKILSGINKFLMETGQRTDPFYDLDLVGLHRETKIYDDIFSIRPTKLIDEVKKTDLIIVTTIFGDIEKELSANADFLPWIKDMHLNKGCEVASLCVGAFLLASTGLVDGRQCSTHWAYADDFQAMFPQIRLVPDKIITEDAGIYSSGGSYSFLNLILYLVQKYNGKDAANWAAKMFEIEIERESQSPYIIFMGQKNHEDVAIKQIQEYLEFNYGEALTLDMLAARFGLSKRNLIRRFKKATGNTPNQYLQRVKMEAAKRDLEKTNHTISEIMFESGYNDVKAFRETFKKLVGIPPSAYRLKYGRA